MVRNKIELRSPDASANPYLVFAVCIAAGLHGIQNKIDPACFFKNKSPRKDEKVFERFRGSLKGGHRYYGRKQMDERSIGRRVF